MFGVHEGCVHGNVSCVKASDADGDSFSFGKVSYSVAGECSNRLDWRAGGTLGRVYGRMDDKMTDCSIAMRAEKLTGGLQTTKPICTHGLLLYK